MKTKVLPTIEAWCFALVMIFFMSHSAFAQQFWFEDFEADGAGTVYSLSTTDGLQFSDGSNDFFTQVPSGTISGNYLVTGQNNTGYFAAQDTDGEATGGSTLSLTFDDVSIAGETDLSMRLLAAEDQSGDGNEDWDSGDLVTVEVDIDNSGTFTPIMQFASQGVTNTEPGLDTDLNGTYDPLTEGPALSDAFSFFVADIAGTGTVMDIRITFTNLTAGDEDFALDYIELFSGSAPIPGCTNAAACNFNASATQDDGSCILIGDACDDGIAYTENDQIQGDCSCAGTTVAFCDPIMWTPVEVLTNNSFSNGGAWTPNGTGYDVSGFCGGGCVEALDTWIVSGGYDFTGVVSSTFYFDAAESFGVTDLEVLYTTSYNGDPSASTWTSLATISTAGSYGIDLSSLGGLTEVYIGIQYLDDGVDGYSSWNVDNLNLSGDCPASLVTFDCPVEMVDFGDPCDDSDPLTINDVIQNDCSCAGTPVVLNNALLISAVYDGPYSSGDGPKGVELYALQNIPDLSIYGLGSANNGGGTDGEEFTFPSDAVNAGDYIFVSANGTTAQTFFASAAVEYDGGSAMGINGDDAVELFEQGVVIDVFGDINLDGSGTAWDYLDTWAVRNCEQGPNGSVFDVAQWTFGPLNVYDPVDSTPGVGLNTDAASPMPVNAYEETCPAIIPGCTDPAADNFDPAANQDDGSCTYTVPSLVINEIHYNPCVAQGIDPDFEFLEIYNNEGAAVDLSDWVISGAVDFTFPLGTSIAVDEYIVVTPVASLYTGNGYQVFECVGSLNNTGETITLSNDALVIVDQVGYSSDIPWPTAPDGSCSSLELIDPALDNTDPANWQASFVVNGTPGAANSTAPPVINYTVVECQTIATAGENVNTTGIVTAVYPSQNLYTIQDGTGPFSGIWVEGSGVAVGDDVEVEGLLIEDADNTLISSATALVLSSGNPLPATELLGTNAVNDEQWEGVLVETTGDVSTGDTGFGEFGIDDGTGEVLADDYAILIAPADLGDTYTVIGPVIFTFGSFKIEPRDANDVLKWGCTDNTFPNFDPDAVIDDGSCAAQIFGCTDPTAINFDATATDDDGSCYFTLPDLVINEIHYNPCTGQGDDDDWEFLEIYNNSGAAVDLEGYTFTQGVTFTFGPGASIADGEYIVLALVAANYSGNGYQVFEMAGALGNGGETVELSDPFGNIIDSVPYDDGAGWPGAADGSCPSLELIDFTLDNTDPANWQASFVANGTPGAVNSLEPPATVATIVEVQTIVPTATDVITSGIVTAVYDADNLFTIQDGLGANTGVWVEGTGIAIGDDVTVEGPVLEPFGVTTIVPETITVNSSGNALPIPITLSTLPANAEEWEGVLIETTSPVSVGDAGFGEFELNDGTGELLVDDLGITVAPLTAGDVYTVTGPMWFSFGNPKLEPRDLNDVEKWGCTDPGACNFDADAVIDSGCDFSCLGCTDSAADNFDPAATIDDGSCFIAGCTYVDAPEYDPTATVDDGSCTVGGASACPTDVNGDGVVNTGDLTSLLGDFGQTCP